MLSLLVGGGTSPSPTHLLGLPRQPISLAHPSLFPSPQKIFIAQIKRCYYPEFGLTGQPQVFAEVLLFSNLIWWTYLSVMRYDSPPNKCIWEGPRVISAAHCHTGIMSYGSLTLYSRFVLASYAWKIGPGWHLPSTWTVGPGWNLLVRPWPVIYLFFFTYLYS